MKVPICSLCLKPASWRRPWDKEYLCKLHFNQAFVKKVRRTINRFKLLQRNDKIAVGISGGKDSVALLDVLCKIEKRYPAQIIAITIDEGIKGYREDGEKFVLEAVERTQVEHHTFSFKKQFGNTLDSTLMILETVGKRLGACAYCGIYRRQLLNVAAKELGATKLATGHNADDEAQTLIMNLVRGNLMTALRSDPVPNRQNPAFVPRIKPFRYTAEQEIVVYTHFNNLNYQETPCPNSGEAQRGIIREIIQKLNETTPDAIFSILKSGDSLLRTIKKLEEHTAFEKGQFKTVRKGKLASCQSCGEPSAKNICRACIVQNEVKRSIRKVC